MSDVASGSMSDSSSSVESSPSRSRLWPGVLIVAAFWIAAIVVNTALDLVISTTFMLTALSALLAALAFGIWWLASRHVPFGQRLLALVVAIVAGIAACLASIKTLGGTGAVFAGLPVLMTLWIGWLLVSRGMSPTTRRNGLIVTILIAWGLICLVRVDGVTGKMFADAHWRWTPTAEEQYLASRATKASAAGGDRAVASEPITLVEGDWPMFRGPGFLGEQEHAPIATNWSEAPPKQVWKRKVGPAWSSFVVLGDRLYTHEQRGEDEATVCLDAATGSELWSHVDRARFWDGQAGAGPRATPTFALGKLYTFGATGVVNCLDPASGKRLWTRDSVADTGAPLPMWGFSSSPLVTHDLVIVFAGGPDDKAVVAYRADSGELAWTAAAGPISYSSAQLVSFAGQEQILLLSDTGVIALDPASGKTLWNHEAAGHGIWRVVQPRQWGESQVLVGSEDLGLTLLNVAHQGDDWNVDVRWTEKSMRPAYNDFVIAGDVAYGFDKGLFCAFDLTKGKRLWKGGRYGYGQVLLLKPQNLLVVLSEKGEVVLMKANPKKHEELGRFSGVTGKTWNHPVVVRNRLYVRNDVEMAAYALVPAEQ